MFCVYFFFKLKKAIPPLKGINDSKELLPISLKQTLLQHAQVYCKFYYITSAYISLKFTVSVVKNHSFLQKNCRSIVSNGTSQFYNVDKWELNNSFLLVSYIMSILMEAPREKGLVH